MRTLVAILALTPALAFAQPKALAQPESTPALQPALVQPAHLALHVLAARAIGESPELRISTGITAPRLIHAVSTIEASMRFSSDYPAANHRVVTSFDVDEHGVPQNVKVETPLDAATRDAVVRAVHQLRYTPATLDGNPVSVPMNLTWTIQSGN